MIKWLLALCCLGVLVVGTDSRTNEVSKPDQKARHLVLGLDGVPHRVLAKLQAEGYFKEFKTPSRMIAPFPSVSNYSWSQILGTEPIHGYLHKHYDPYLNTVYGSVTQESTVLAFPNAFNYYHAGVIHHLKAYMSAMGMLKRDMAAMGDALLADNKEQLFYAYSVETDALTHTEGLDRLSEALIFIDGYLTGLRQRHLEKFGQTLDITIVSDHGMNTIENIKFADGDVFADLKKQGFKLGKSLRSKDDLVYIACGMDPAMMFWIKDPRKMELAKTLGNYAFSDIIVAIDPSTNEYVVTGFEKSEIRFSYDAEKKTYQFTRISANNSPQLDLSDLKEGDSLSEEDVFQRTLKTPYPNSIERMRRALKGTSKYPASVLVSLKEGYMRGDGITKKAFSITRGTTFTTHGSLLGKESEGVLVSTHKVYSPHVRVQDVSKLIDGHDFHNRYPGATLIKKEEGNWVMRLGSEFISGKPIVKIRVKAVNFQKMPLVQTLEVPAVNQASFPTDHVYQDIDFTSLARKLDPSFEHGLLVEGLNGKGKAISKTKYIRINLQTGYLRQIVPIKGSKNKTY